MQTKLQQALNLPEFLGIVGKLTLLFSNYWALLMCSGIPCYQSCLCPLGLHGGACECVNQENSQEMSQEKCVNQENAQEQLSKTMVSTFHQRGGFSLFVYLFVFSYKIILSFFEEDCILQIPQESLQITLLLSGSSSFSFVGWWRGWYTQRTILKFPELNRKFLHLQQQILDMTSLV